MMLPTRTDRGVVVFLLFPSLGYERRLFVSFALVATGFVVQVATLAIFPGLVLLIAGNALLLVRGYDNRIDWGGFDPDARWERVDIEKLDDLRALDKKIKKWDLSALDISNPLGLVAFLLVAGGLGVLFAVSRGNLRIVALDALVLLVPHWLTGIRSILRTPQLLVRIDTIKQVLNRSGTRLKDHRVIPLMLLKGDEAKLPEDVKFKIDIAGAHPDFLGLYGQVVINDVQGKSYPYFYVVLVARKGYGLHDAFRGFRPSEDLTKEFKVEEEVEVMVIRQHTTETSGYHTKPAVAAGILYAGLNMAEGVAVKATA
jgi:hypothetical protein